MLNFTENFEIFDDIVNGELNPVLLGEKDEKQLILYLEENYNQCEEMHLVKFEKKPNKRLELVSKHELSNAHPLVPEYFTQVALNFPKNKDFPIPDYVLRQLDIDLTNATINCIERTKKYNILGISRSTNWTSFTTDNLKYFYFNTLLSSSVKTIKKGLRQSFFSMDDIRLKQSVSRIQHLLNNFSVEILNSYDFSHQDLEYQVKDYYDNKDCLALVYLYLVDLVSFLEKEQKPHIDKDVKILFHSGILKKYEFLDKTKYIQKQFDEVELEPILRKILQTPLDKVLNICIENRLTYHEVNYFNQFLLTMERNFKTCVFEEVTQDHIIRFLFELNFNTYELVDFIIELMTRYLESLSDIKAKEAFLAERLKCIKQLITKSKEPYQKQIPPLKNLVLNWIEGELFYIRQTIEIENSNESSTYPIEFSKPDQKFVTNLSVPQLALFSKLLYESGIIQANSTQEMLKLVSNNVCTPQADEISVKSLSNNIYDIKQGSLDEVKSKLIDMINNVNAM